MPGGGDLQQRQHQHVRAVFDWEAKELLDLLVLAHLRQPQETFHQVQAFPARREDKAVKRCGGGGGVSRRSLEAVHAETHYLANHGKRMRRVLR